MQMMMHSKSNGGAPRDGRPARRAAALAVLATPLLLGAGCATYAPVGIEELPPQQPIRVRLAPEELARHIAFASGGQGRMSGRFVEASGDSATLVLTSPTAHSQVRVPLEAIVELERKDASHGRSILLTGALVGGVALLAYLGFEGNQGADSAGDDDVTDQFAPRIGFVIPMGR